MLFTSLYFLGFFFFFYQQMRKLILLYKEMGGVTTLVIYKLNKDVWKGYNKLFFIIKLLQNQDLILILHRAFDKYSWEPTESKQLFFKWTIFHMLWLMFHYLLTSQIIPYIMPGLFLAEILCFVIIYTYTRLISNTFVQINTQKQATEILTQ